MPTGGPCRVEGCCDPDRSGGQWAYIPEAYCLAHGLTCKQDCTCKKPQCLRACGKLLTLPQPPGRKRKGSPASPVTTASLLEEPLPRPPSIVTIDEIWADRCAALPQPFGRRPSLVPRLLCADCARCASHGRCVDIEALDEVERGNVLEEPRSTSLEYAVHGKWRRADGDRKGVDGCWYVGVDELVEAFGADAVNAKLAEYEAAQVAARESAVAAAVARRAARRAAEAEGEEGAGAGL